MSRTSRSFLIGIAGTITWAMLAPAATAAEPAQSDDAARGEARQILAASGVSGGLVVHLGCTDGHLTAALRANDAYVVQGLATDAAAVEKARRYVQSLGVYGNVSVDAWKGGRLPYVDNLVNLLVADDVHGCSMDEIMRVLAPGGAACLRQEGRWVVRRKPRPAEIDEWTHCLRDASNNAVSQDTVVGPPEHMQWVAEPRNTRHHNTLAGVSAAVTTGGRLFYIIDDAPIASILLPAQWQLAARDAFNGVLLWKRPINVWKAHMQPFRNGPVDLGRRLVAVGDRVYVTLGLDAPVAALDAATGRTVTTYPGTKGTEEILYRDGTLFLVIGSSAAGKDAALSPPVAKGKAVGFAPFPGRAVAAVDAVSGKLRWKRADARPVNLSLTADRDRVYWLDNEAVVAVNAQTGADVWRAKRDVAPSRPQWSGPALVVQGDVLLCADRLLKPTQGDSFTGQRVPAWASENFPAQLVAYSAATGRPLWNAPCAESFCSPVDVFVNENLVWLGLSRGRVGPDYTQARNLLTGRVERRIQPDLAFETTMSHHRCHRDRATVRYLVAGRTGVEFIDVHSGAVTANNWVRGTCQYGVVPANGLLYAPPHSCACYIEAKLTGLLALAPKGKEEGAGSREEKTADEQSARLEPGPANAPLPTSHSPLPTAEDWPTYRHDAARSGRASTAVPTDLKCAWQARFGSRVTSPVIAEGRVLVASPDTHTVYALNRGDGKTLWQFTAGGRIDSPPTIAAGRAVFGAADGWVYCLRASDGTLAWRYRVAPANRHMVACGQVESAWPASGSVLVRDGAVYCCAGRSSYLDGGIWLAKLDLNTGRRLAEHRVDKSDPLSAEEPKPLNYEMPGALPDVLSSDGPLVYMRHLAYDPAELSPRLAPAHLYAPAGLLNDDWWQRTYWIFGTHFYSGYIGWYFAGHETPAGRLLVVDDTMIYGFGYQPQSYTGDFAHGHHLFAIDRGTAPPQPTPNYQRANRDYPHSKQHKFYITMRWSQDVPLLGRAMTLAGGTIFMAGPPSDALTSRAVHDGSEGAILWAAAAADGKTLAAYHIDALPVFDGLAAASGRLYLTLQDGRLLCLADRRSTPGGADLPRQPPSATAKPR